MLCLCTHQLAALSVLWESYDETGPVPVPIESAGGGSPAVADGLSLLVNRGWAKETWSHCDGPAVHLTVRGEEVAEALFTNVNLGDLRHLLRR